MQQLQLDLISKSSSFSKNIHSFIWVVKGRGRSSQRNETSHFIFAALVQSYIHISCKATQYLHEQYIIKRPNKPYTNRKTNKSLKNSINPHHDSTRKKSIRIRDENSARKFHLEKKKVFHLVFQFRGIFSNFSTYSLWQAAEPMS